MKAMKAMKAAAPMTATAAYQSVAETTGLQKIVKEEAQGQAQASQSCHDRSESGKLAARGPLLEADQHVADAKR